MAITIDSAQKFQELVRLYEDFKLRDMFTTAGEAFAGASDVLRGSKASDLIKKYGGAMSDAEREKARNDLLTTLANYQAKRREDLRARDKDRLDFLKQQYGDIAGERRWAMEQEVALERERMGNQTQITSARMGALIAEMNDSDRELETGGFRRARNDNQRREMIDPRVVVRVDEYINTQKKNKNLSGAPATTGTLVADFQRTVGAIPDGQREHALRYVANNVDGFTDAISEARRGGDLARANPGFAEQVEAARAEETRHKRQRDQWLENREQVWNTFERQGAAGAPPELMRKLRAIYDEGPEETSRRVEEMLSTLPDEIRNPAEERPLEDDDFTRQIQAQLDRLDDPRYMFAGSRHERIKLEIMRSPEFQQYMAEKGDGGMIDPNEAFRMMLKETKAGLLTGNRDAQTVAAADARSLGGPSVIRPPSAPSSTLASGKVAGAFGRQATSRLQRRADQLRSELGAGTSPGGPKREMLRELGKKTTGVAEGFRDSTMKASQSAANVSRLIQQLNKQEEDE